MTRSIVFGARNRAGDRSSSPSRRPLAPLSGLVFLAAPLLLLAIAGSAAAQTDAVVSHGVQAGLVDEETRLGTTVRPSDLFDVDTGNLVFDAFGDNPLSEDLDAAYVRPNGNVIFSTNTDVTQPFPGLPGGFKNGDLIEWDGTQGQVFFSESSFSAGSDPNISAFHLFESGPNAGRLLLGTSGSNDELGGLGFEWGNLLLYDPGTDTSSLYFDQDLISGTLTQRTIDAVHVLANGNLVLSTLLDNGFLGGIQLKAKDLVEFDPGASTGGGSVFLNGTDLFDGRTRNIDAAFVVPEPASALLVGLGLAGLTSIPRRR